MTCAEAALLHNNQQTMIDWLITLWLTTQNCHSLYSNSSLGMLSSALAVAFSLPLGSQNLYRPI